MKDLGKYLHIKQVLDQALLSGGGDLSLATHGAVVQWRQQAYTFRKKWRESLPEGAISEYDKLTFLKPEPDETVAHIRLVGQKLQGVFTPTGAGPVAPSPTVPAKSDDPLLDFALSLSSELDKNEDAI